MGTLDRLTLTETCCILFFGLFIHGNRSTQSELNYLWWSPVSAGSSPPVAVTIATTDNLDTLLPLLLGVTGGGISVSGLLKHVDTVFPTIVLVGIQ